MQGSFTSYTYNVTALLGRASFPNYSAQRVVVPVFQRGYSWEQGHVATFWDDLFSFHQQSANRSGLDTYFLGPIVVIPEEEKGYISLLDGQQRLATTTILLAVIRDIARAKGGQLGSDLARDIHRDLIMVDDEADVYALTLGELDDLYFRTVVQEDPPSTSMRPRLRSHRLIAQAKNFLHSKVTELVDGLGAKELVGQLKQLRRTVASQLKMVAIEVRSEEEAFLIFETLNDRGLRLAVPDLVLNYLMRTANNDAQRKEIRRHWSAVIEHLGQRNPSTFLRHMWVSRYGDVKSQSLFREMRSNFAKHNVESLEFAKLCADESRQYAAITSVDKNVLGEHAVPHVEGLIRYLEADRTLPLLLSGISCLEQTEFAKLTKALVTVVTRHTILANLNPTDLETTLYVAARRLRTAHEAGRSSSECLWEAKEELRKVNPTQQQLNSAISDVVLTKKQAGYVVYALAQAIQSPTKTISLEGNSIEHIFPENAEIDAWPTAEDMEPLAWHIGNLIVLEETYNREAGRRPYQEKKDVYGKSTIVAVQNISKEYSDWNASTIIERAKTLVPLIGTVWPENI